MPHYVDIDPAKEWDNHWQGYFVRVRGAVTEGCLAALSSAGAAWADLGWLAIAIAMVGVGAIGFSLLGRRSYLRRAKSEEQLHHLFHSCRDSLYEALSQEEEKEKIARIALFHNDVAERIAQVFRERTGDPSISCAIRLADNRDGGRYYVTRGRSKNMNPERNKTSQPLADDEGIAKALRYKNHRGVYGIHSIKDAIDDDIWKHDANDKLPDVRCLMVAPINGWWKGDKVMFGLLYVNSCNNCFRPTDSFPILAIADYLGSVCGTLFETSHSPTERMDSDVLA